MPDQRTDDEAQPEPRRPRIYGTPAPPWEPPDWIAERQESRRQERLQALRQFEQARRDD